MNYLVSKIKPWKFKEYAPILVRYGVSIVFLLFGIDQILNPQNWFSWTPRLAETLYSNVDTFWFVNGIFDLAVGVLLILGLFTRVISVLAIFHLVGVIFSLGYNDISIRDFGLLLAAISILLHGADKLCLHRKIFRKKFSQ